MHAACWKRLRKDYASRVPLCHALRIGSQTSKLVRPCGEALASLPVRGLYPRSHVYFTVLLYQLWIRKKRKKSLCQPKGCIKAPVTLAGSPSGITPRDQGSDF
eukprot:1148997-Pelagomonas_calceolata.AAC.1